jgi:HPt (histidine-containing phosphotransfer) domain-containing protein
VIDATIVLDLEQLREVTLDDDELMGQILTALIDDTARQIPLLQAAIRERDAPKCARLAHYSKGACANVGANAAAAVLEAMERQAASGSMAECSMQLARLASEVERLRQQSEPRP